MRSEPPALALALCVLALAGCSKQAPPGAGLTAATSRNVAAATSREVTSATSAPPVEAPSSAAPVVVARLPQTEVTWSYPDTPVGPMNAVVVLPERAADERFPVLLTFHGTGEARKGPEKGARGWLDDYGMYRALERLKHPPLVAADFEGFADEARLAKLNAALAEAPYRGLVIVNSYTPDMLRGDEPFSKVPPLAKFVVDELLARARRETPAIGTAQTTGIDGISLGGRAALSIGLRYPEAFAAIGGLQPAFDTENASLVAQNALVARQKNPSLSFRLLTSDGDYFLGATKAISQAMKQAGVPNTLVVVRGPHDYPFNRGPAVYELLVHHDRVLRGLSPPL
ncbi:MAG TPA: alpha/beta hydrolase-fold protein [Polyangiaceae bacterium]|nr:alpha/beta hydrolase-fold protein [Polyangiaceae bacterium]